MPTLTPSCDAPVRRLRGTVPRGVAIGLTLGLVASLLSACSSSPIGPFRFQPGGIGQLCRRAHRRSLGSHIAEASQRFDVPEQWIRAVMKVESGGRTHMNGKPIVSRAGAMGLMQVMPSTYEELRVRHGLGSDPFEPHDNIMAGTAYLREMYEKFGSPGFLAAYNAGPGRYGEYLTGDRGLPSETRNYVAMISPQINGGGAEPPRRGYDVRGDTGAQHPGPHGCGIHHRSATDTPCRDGIGTPHRSRSRPPLFRPQGRRPRSSGATGLRPRRRLGHPGRRLPLADRKQQGGGGSAPRRSRSPDARPSRGDGGQYARRPPLPRPPDRRILRQRRPRLRPPVQPGFRLHDGFAVVVHSCALSANA